MGKKTTPYLKTWGDVKYEISLGFGDYRKK